MSRESTYALDPSFPPSLARARSSWPSLTTATCLTLAIDSITAGSGVSRSSPRKTRGTRDRRRNSPIPSPPNETFPAGNLFARNFARRVISPSSVIVGGRSVRGQWWLSCIAGSVSIIAEIDISLSHDIIAGLGDGARGRGSERKKERKREGGRRNRGRRERLGTFRGSVLAAGRER